MPTTFIRKCKPSVSRRWLWLLSGLLWSAVGITLCVMACNWLREMDLVSGVTGGIAGFGSGVIIYLFGFSRIARKNINRIAALPERVCLFAFQAWRSYLLIVFMMLLGFTLRHSPTPRIILAIIYAGIGEGLALSSVLYYRRM